MFRKNSQKSQRQLAREVKRLHREGLDNIVELWLLTGVIESLTAQK